MKEVAKIIEFCYLTPECSWHVWSKEQLLHCLTNSCAHIWQHPEDILSA